MPQTQRCITDEELGAWVAGEVRGEQLSALSSHVAGCVTCRVVVAELARSGARPAASVVGRYQLQERVGEGGMGVVWAAWDPSVGRKVAVKLLHERGEQRGRAERFLVERQVLGGLTHPNIAQLLDTGELPDGRPYLVMEFVEGVPLDSSCDARRLTVRERLALLLPVFDAVDFSHRRLVVHRDLKPSNVLVTPDGTPKLLDFGIARLLDDPRALTQTGHAPMTPAYAAPEQARLEPVSTATDVYALGVVLYELLTGTSPYPVARGDVEALLQAVRELEPPLPSVAVAERATDAAVAARGATRQGLVRQLAGDLDAVVAMALRKRPEDRYPSVHALGDDVRAVLEGTATVARRGDRLYRATRFARRHAVGLTALSASFLALGAGLVGTLWQARQARAERDVAERRFADVRAMAHSVLFDYHDAIADLPGSTPVRERLVRDAVASLDALRLETQGDRALTLELASGYLKAGQVQGDPYSASLGDTVAARRSWEAARSLAEAVLAAHPSDPDARQVLARVHEKVGGLDEVSGEMDAALAAYRRAGELDAALVAERPDDLELRYALTNDDIAEGQLLTKLGRADEAAVALERCLARRRAFAQALPDTRARRGLVTALLSKGNLLREVSHLAEALETLREASSLAEQLVAEHPDSADLTRVRDTAWNALADAARQAKDLPTSLEYARKPVESSAAALARDPRNSVLARDLVLARLQLAQVLSATDRLDEARAEAREAEAGLLRLREKDPSNLQVLEDLCQGLVRVAFIELDHQRWAEAEAVLARVETAASALLALDPDSLAAEEAREEAHASRALCLQARGRLGAALEQVDAAEQGLTRVLARTALDTRLKNKQVELLVLRGELLGATTGPRQAQAREAARAALRQAGELAQRLQAADDLLPSVAERAQEGAALLARLEASPP